MNDLGLTTQAKMYLRGLTKYGRSYFQNYAQSGLPHLLKYDPVLIGERVDAMVDCLGLKNGGNILDFGCGKGFYVENLRSRGMNAFGFDMGAYSFLCASKLVGSRYIFARPAALARFVSVHGKFDLVIAKDVLEHVHPLELNATASFLSAIAARLLVVVPVSAKKGVSQSLVYADPTHLTALSDLEWGDLLGRFGRTREDEELNARLKEDKSGANCTFVVDLFGDGRPLPPRRHL